MASQDTNQRALGDLIQPILLRSSCILQSESPVLRLLISLDEEPEWEATYNKISLNYEMLQSLIQARLKPKSTSRANKQTSAVEFSRCMIFVQPN